MSCMIEFLPGGDPRREIFPLSLDRIDNLESVGRSEILAMLGVGGIEQLAFDASQFIGAALKPDGTAFYLTTIAPDFGRTKDPVGSWRGGFFAPFGVGDVVGIVEGELLSPGALPTSLNVKARLLLDAGGNPAVYESGRTPHVSVDWVVRGNQATRANKSSIIQSVTIHDAGPHDAADIRRCVALHAPQRSFGEVRAVIAMQCGVAAACLLEAIC
jgi:hypothetical protein